MTTLIICEKPSAAEKIAQALADTKPVKKTENKVSYYELTHNKKQIYVGCAVGHLYNLQEKNKKGWTYPVYETEWLPSNEIGKGSTYTKKYLTILEKLAKKADEFYVACDYDVEGSLIGYNIIRFTCKQKDGKRMKFSTLTKDELKESFEKASKHLDFKLIQSGEARHITDWLFGINLSRALTLAIKHATNRFKILSSGRVQGPALKLLADREREIKKFKPVPFWEIEAKGDVLANHKQGRFWKEQEVKKIHTKIKNEKSADVEKIESKIFEQEPPHPFDLTALQLEAYKTMKITPKATLETAQSLYTDAYISYPRTSSNQLPPQLNLKKIIKDLSKQSAYQELCKEILETKLIPNNGKKQDPAHPAIHPTGIQPKNLTKHEQQIYDLIVRRTLASFAKPSKRETVTATLDIKGESFITKGTRTIDSQWQKFYGKYVMYKEEEIPKLKEKQTIKIQKIDLQAKETQPPKRFTQASIIKELEKRNLGTKATRSSILDALYIRNYIRENSIEVTDLGLKTIETLEKYCPEILDEEMTRQLEKDMEEIREGEEKEDEVIDKAKKHLGKILEHFKDNENKIGKLLSESYQKTQEEESVLTECPLCKKAKLRIMYSRRFKSYFVACSGYPKCKNTFSLPKYALPKPAKSVCKECGYPEVLMIRKGKRPYTYCINKECKLKEEWAKAMEEKAKLAQK